MESIVQYADKFSQKITFKAIAIAILSLVLLIPTGMIQVLIKERKERSLETISKIDNKWSKEQTINGPYIVVPYKTTVVDNKKNTTNVYEHNVIICPQQLNIKAILKPEERHYGIYKSILYQSDIQLNGNFMIPAVNLPDNSEINWKDAYIQLWISDLRGLRKELSFLLDNNKLMSEPMLVNSESGRCLRISLSDIDLRSAKGDFRFDCQLNLNGSKSINFIPIGKTTDTKISGFWKSPSFIGNFSPESKIEKSTFMAHWNILHYNRNIPQVGTDDQLSYVAETSYGVDLVSAVDQYQQNMRMSKYAILFILLTFVVFFFVEILGHKKIHLLQYLLIGLALVLFYSLLLSISEHIGFGWAYLISSVLTVCMAVSYAYGIFKRKSQTAILAALLIALYALLYVILQIDDYALLIGSVGLFLILGIIMFISRKISWDKQ